MNHRPGFGEDAPARLTRELHVWKFPGKEKFRVKFPENSPHSRFISWKLL